MKLLMHPVSGRNATIGLVGCHKTALRGEKRVLKSGMRTNRLRQVCDGGKSTERYEYRYGKRDITVRICSELSRIGRGTDLRTSQRDDQRMVFTLLVTPGPMDPQI